MAKNKIILSGSAKMVILIIFMLATSISMVTIRGTSTNTQSSAEHKIICPSQQAGQDTVQMMFWCIVPTHTPTPTPPPLPPPSAGGTTSGPASKCEGTPVAFGVPKKLINIGGARKGTCFKPKWIVMHITASTETSAEQLFKYFNSGASGRAVGAHFAIGIEGDNLQMFESFADKFETGAAVSNYNSGAISIEITRKTVFNSKGEVPPKQYAEAVRLVKALMKQYNIPVGQHDANWQSPNNNFVDYPPGVYGHYQLNPATRTDPGKGFLRDFKVDIAAP